jgi:DNA-binding NarL/FixJ family response regulator
MSTIRVLVVDDYEPLRRVVRLILQLRDDLQIIGEASDGLEAVQTAKALQPDLILLDIDLPTLNGIQAARRLHELVPQAKILFLSIESSPDVVREAFSAGGSGYVYKLNIGSELLTAIETVLRGTEFVGSELGFAQTARHHRSHEMLIYSEEKVLLENFTRFTVAALRAGKPAIVVATKSQLDTLLQSLNAEGVDATAASESGAFIPLDVRKTLSTFMVNDLPDPVRFVSVATDLIGAATKAATGAPRRISACGVCAPVLWAEGKIDAAVWLERLCNNLAEEHELDILCAYPSSSFQDGKDERAFKKICAEHTAVYSR